MPRYIVCSERRGNEFTLIGTSEEVSDASEAILQVGHPSQHGEYAAFELGKAERFKGVVALVKR